MSNDASKEEILSSEEIEALVERASEPGFDDGEFRAHDFSGGQSLSMSKWTELSHLVEKHAEALQGILSSEFGVPVLVEPRESIRCNRQITNGVPGAPLSHQHSNRTHFQRELHLLLPGELLTKLVNHYFGGGSLPAPSDA